jgi:SH3-like domain-containing protein
MVNDVVTRHKNLADKLTVQSGSRQKIRRQMVRSGFGSLWVLVTVIAMFCATCVVAADETNTGPVTHLPLPRFVSMKAAEGNVRRGPSLSHRIDWVFTRRDMPLEITAEHGHWRRVQDRDGLGGWVHYSLLSGNRTVITDKDMLTLHARPDAATPIVAALELGVIARLGECTPDWCELTSGGYRGWALKDALWGVGADEIRE